MKMCNKCLCETERYASGDCKPCKKALSAVHYTANKEKYKANRVAHYAANTDKTKATQAAYRNTNAFKIKAQRTAYYTSNSDNFRVYRADYYAANSEKIKERNAAWAKENPEKAAAIKAAWVKANSERSKTNVGAWHKANPTAMRIYSQNRRARKLAAGGKLSKGLSEKLLKLQKGKCACCKQPLGDNYHLDHIMPLVLGGSNTDDNMQLLRQICNLQKSAKHPIDFMQSRGLLL